MYILALEVSTSSAKVILYSTQKGIIKYHSIPYSNNVSNLTSQEPEGIYLTAIKAARVVLENINCKVEAIGLSSTWHSM